MRTINQITSLVVLACLLICNAAAKIIYVDDDAPGANNGTSWKNAYIYLQDALADSETIAKPVEIRVAGGTYTPNQGGAYTYSDSREAAFFLIEGVTISGGYAGTDANDPNTRDIELYETILSGDQKGNDKPANDPCDFYEISRNDNSYNVVVAEDTNETAVLDGVTITAGIANYDKDDYAENRSWLKHGAGLFCRQARPIIANCTFEFNAARGGAGLYNEAGEPNLLNCRFTDNVTLREDYNYGGLGSGLLNVFGRATIRNCVFEENFAASGAGIYNFQSNPTVRNCSFVGNYAEEHAGGMYNYDSSPVVTGCVFERNTADMGGGMFNAQYSSPVINDCVFSGNLALHYGGGMYNSESSPDISGCVLNANTAFDCGGGICNDTATGTIIKKCEFTGNSSCEAGAMQNYYSDMEISNCIFTGNSAIRGTAIQNYSGYLMLTNCTFSKNKIRNVAANRSNGTNQTQNNDTDISSIFPYDPDEPFDENIVEPGGLECLNCIFWEEENTIWRSIDATITVSYSDIQGDYDGIGNINEDPQFANPGFWADRSDSNVLLEPDDPNAVWFAGDYHLNSEAGRFDPNGDNWVIDDVTSPCIDAGAPNTLVGDEPEPNGGRINMGAYGGTSEASKSPPQ
ncbi:MAG: hypothetical protein JW715_02060 [Sedimentisphaerales bacterium]|nr:hypothetical protein [Sedimentisphaerales bacterium]